MKIIIYFLYVFKYQYHKCQASEKKRLTQHPAGFKLHLFGYYLIPNEYFWQ